MLLAHQGGDLEYHNYASTEPHAEVMSELVGRPVGFIDDVCGPAAREAVEALADGEILLLDNVRYCGEELTLFERKLNLSPEDQAKTLLVRKLAPLADLYVCDAFAAAHRSQPSLVGLEQVLPSAMGRLFEREYENLARLREAPARPCVFVLGGTKIQEAFPMMAAALADGVVDVVLTAGLVANVMLAASGRRHRGAVHGLHPREPAGAVHRRIEEHPRRARRQDRAARRPRVRRRRRPRRGGGRPTCRSPSRSSTSATRTSPTTSARIAAAGTVFVNGPAGVFEKPETEYGTRALWEAMAGRPRASAPWAAATASPR